MIEIFANGKPLVLYRDTTLTLEYNNALFASDAIEGDVVYSFDIPVQGNEIALEFEHLPYVQSHKKHDCTIRVDGIDLVTGKLVVQRVTKIRYSVAVQVNPYPEGFAERKITANDSESVTISTDRATHNINFKNFLHSTLTDDRIKLAPIVNSEGYGDENKDFGVWMGQSIGNIVNRLYFGTGNAVVESRDLTPFIRIFNETHDLWSEAVVDEYGNQVEGSKHFIERNQFSFVPQIRLGYILQNIIENSGYKYINRFDEDVNLRNIYIQSSRALDATSAQYAGSIPTSYAVHLTCKYFNYVLGTDQDYDTEGMCGGPGLGDEVITFRASGWYNVKCTCHFHEPYGSDIFFGVTMFRNDGHYDTSTFVVEKPIMHADAQPHNGRVYSDPMYEAVFEERIYIPASIVGTPCIIYFFRDLNGSKYLVNPSSGDVLQLSSIYIEEVAYDNIYRKDFRFAEFFPSLSNGDFLKRIIKSLGLCMWVGSDRGSIEIEPYESIKNARSIDLTNYILENETEKEGGEETTTRWRISPYESEDIREENILPPVDTFNQLPDCYSNPEKICLVKDRNAYYKAEKVEDESLCWRMEWVRISGNRSYMEVGDGDEVVEKNTDAVVPSMEELNGTNGLVPSIPATIVSDLYNSDQDNTSDIVMLYYRGLRHVNEIKGDLKYQDMRPVVNGSFSLSVDSIGEDMMRNYITVTEHSTKISYKLRLPMAMAKSVQNLMLPQDEDPEIQTRWIMVDNVRSLPRKISFEIENNNGMVLCEIEAAKPD